MHLTDSDDAIRDQAKAYGLDRYPVAHMNLWSCLGPARAIIEFDKPGAPVTRFLGTEHVDRLTVWEITNV
jgi:hypothetical protein